jgi:hypothetical protein
MNSGPQSPADQSIVQLLGRLKPAQAWAVATALVALLSGAFIIGNRLGAHQSEVLETNLNLAIQHKTFMDTYLRYLINQRIQLEGPPIPPSQFEEEVNSSREALVSLLSIWYKQDSAPGRYIVHPQFEKGWNDSVLYFDHTSYPIPWEIKREVIKRSGGTQN